MTTENLVFTVSSSCFTRNRDRSNFTTINYKLIFFHIFIYYLLSKIDCETLIETHHLLMCYIWTKSHQRR